MNLSKVANVFKFQTFKLLHIILKVESGGNGCGVEVIRALKPWIEAPILLLIKRVGQATIFPISE